MEKRILIGELVDISLIEKCDEMYVDPNCVAGIAKLFLDSESKSSDAQSMEYITAQLGEEIRGYSYDGFQVMFMYDCALDLYNKYQDSEHSLNDFFAQECRNNLENYYHLEEYYCLKSA